MSDGEEDDDNDYEGYDSGDDRGLMQKNTNAEEVMKIEKMKKDALRAESHKKKEKDREDREKQKQLQADRKEKEKKRTMKGEKRRWYCLRLSMLLSLNKQTIQFKSFCTNHVIVIEYLFNPNQLKNLEESFKSQ